MKFFLALVTLLSMFSSPANATEFELECGDHWFNVTVIWSDGSTVGAALFGGDSQVDRSSSPASVDILDGDLTASFRDSHGGYLTIKNFAGGSDLGLVRETASSSELSISPCYVR